MGSAIVRYLAVALASALLGAFVADRLHVAGEAKETVKTVEKVAGAVLDHSKQQEVDVGVYREKIEKLETDLAASLVATGVLRKQVRAVTAERSELAAAEASCRNLVDDYRRLGELAAEGAGLVEELSLLVKRRDAQLELALKQVNNERGLGLKLLNK